MPPEDGAGPSGSVPVIFAFCGAGIAAMGFGAGYGASAYRRSNAFKELLEKFPEPPSAEAEQLARSGAGRAFLYGTGLAGLMGVGAVMAARANGIRSAQDLADAIKSWLPSREGLEVWLAALLSCLPRTRAEPRVRPCTPVLSGLHGSQARALAADGHRALASRAGAFFL